MGRLKNAITECTECYGAEAIEAGWIDSCDTCRGTGWVYRKEPAKAITPYRMADYEFRGKMPKRFGGVR